MVFNKLVHRIKGLGGQTEGNAQPEVTSSTNEPIEIKIQEKPKEVIEKPIIKVKSFAIVSDEYAKSTAKKTEETPGNPYNPSANDKSSLVLTKEYASGAFLVLRTDAANTDPPIWKIDGKSLLQKYSAFNENGKVLYKSTAEYAGWSLPNKGDYYPTLVTVKEHNKKDHIVQLDKIKLDPKDGE